MSSPSSYPAPKTSGISPSLAFWNVRGLAQSSMFPQSVCLPFSSVSASRCLLGASQGSPRLGLSARSLGSLICSPAGTEPSCGNVTSAAVWFVSKPSVSRDGTSSCRRTAPHLFLAILVAGVGCFVLLLFSSILYWLLLVCCIYINEDGMCMALSTSPSVLSPDDSLCF